MTNTLTRLSVNLIPKAAAALELAVTLSEDSRTDTVNQALQFYAYFLQVRDEGGVVYVRRTPAAELDRIELL